MEAEPGEEDLAGLPAGCQTGEGDPDEWSSGLDNSSAEELQSPLEVLA
jgi:hypothetical protein